MLNKTESKVMDYIYERCKGERKVLFTPKELLDALMPKTEITAKELDVIMNNLVLDDYIESQRAEKDTRPYFVVGLTIKGAAYDRERKALKSTRMQSLLWKILLGVVGAIASWGVLMLLNGWF